MYASDGSGPWAYIIEPWEILKPSGTIDCHRGLEYRELIIQEPVEIPVDMPTLEDIVIQEPVGIPVEIPTLGDMVYTQITITMSDDVWHDLFPQYADPDRAIEKRRREAMKVLTSLSKGAEFDESFLSELHTDLMCADDFVREGDREAGFRFYRFLLEVHQRLLEYADWFEWYRVKEVIADIQKRLETID